MSTRTIPQRTTETRQERPLAFIQLPDVRLRSPDDSGVSLRFIQEVTMATGKKAASAAGKTLGKKGEPNLEKTAEASALAQTKKGPAKKK